MLLSTVLNSSILLVLCLSDQECRVSDLVDALYQCADFVFVAWFHHHGDQGDLCKPW
jgi:hypothetical protein